MEKYLTLRNCGGIEKLYETAMKNGIQFVIVSISGHDLDCVRDYTLKFKSQTDLDKFNFIYKKFIS